MVISALFSRRERRFFSRPIGPIGLHRREIERERERERVTSAERKARGPAFELEYAACWSEKHTRGDCSLFPFIRRAPFRAMRRDRTSRGAITKQHDQAEPLIRG